MHMHLCILPSSPTSVFVQATRLKNWDRSWDRDWKGLTSSAESWTLRTAIIPFWVWFLRYLIWFQRLCEWYFRNLQEISFGCHLVQVRHWNVLKQMLFLMPRTDDPSVFGGGTEHYFSGWQLGGLQELHMACNLDIRVLSNDAERSMTSICLHAYK